jgi:hypothetical protein
LILYNHCFEEEKIWKRKESWQNIFCSYLFPLVYFHNSATLLSRQSEIKKMDEKKKRRKIKT